MGSLRDRAIAAYEKEKQLAPTYHSIQVENWVADEFDIECEPVVWEKEWQGEVDLGEVSLWVDGEWGAPNAWLMWRCPHCGQVDLGHFVSNLATLGEALLEERQFCSKCGRTYAED